LRRKNEKELTKDKNNKLKKRIYKMNQNNNAKINGLDGTDGG